MEMFTQAGECSYAEWITGERASAEKFAANDDHEASVVLTQYADELAAATAAP